MKTILATFKGSSKQYTFLLDNKDVKIGDRITASNYKSELIVEKFFSKLFKFGDVEGGLFETKTESNQFMIKLLEDVKIVNK